MIKEYVNFVVVEKLQRFSTANNMTSLHEYFDQFLYEGSRLLVGTRLHILIVYMCV